MHFVKCRQVEESFSVTEKWVLKMEDDGVLSQVSTETIETWSVFTLDRAK